MDIWDTAYTLAPGHRLRLWLGSSDTPTHEPLPVAGRNLILHDAEHPSQLLLSVASDQPVPARPAPGARCRPRRSFTVRVPRGLRHVHATVGGRRARVVSRGGRRVVVVHPRAGGKSVVVRIRGVDRHGRRVATKRRYSLCR
jgi:hypothetical protein